MSKHRAANGAVIYRGPSELDGGPVLCVVTGLRDASANAKTGPMLQTWILRADVNPLRAIDRGLDASVCGECRFRRGGCYVVWAQAPLAVWQRYRRDACVSLAEVERIGEGRRIRIGSAGDPVAVPQRVWDALLRRARAWTAYTHQHATHPSWSFSRFAMASTETPEQTRSAWAEGWRTFRARPKGAPLLAGEVNCPATEGRTACAWCTLCNGGDKGPNISTEVHGGAVQLRQASKTAQQ